MGAQWTPRLLRFRIPTHAGLYFPRPDIHTAASTAYNAPRTRANTRRQPLRAEVRRRRREADLA